MDLKGKGLNPRPYDEDSDRRKRLRATKVGRDIVDRVWTKALDLAARVRFPLGKAALQQLVKIFPGSTFKALD